MVEDSLIDELPSYFMECLVYNVPNSILTRTTWVEVIRGILGHVYESLEGPEPDEESLRWLEVNECKYLFHSAQKWSRSDGRKLTQSAWTILATPTQRKRFEDYSVAVPRLLGSLVTKPFRILALDGGGLRGIFTAAVLCEAARVFGPAFMQSVDLLVGTSTGGIIALGLAAGKTPADMLNFYQDAGPRIFGNPRKIGQLWSPKYDRGPLDDLLRKEFGESTKMNDLQKPVCISAYELVHGTTRVWKDDHHKDLSFGGDQLVWKVAAGNFGGAYLLCASAAPRRR